jgi:membrane-bound lytic murein transglycosylase D
MNTHISLLLPVIMIVSLVGCNTLATKPSSGREKLSQQQALEDVADNNSTQNSSSVDSTYRIETEPTDLAWAFFDKAFAAEQSNLFATPWPDANEPPPKQSMKKVSPTLRLSQQSPQTLPQRILQLSSTTQLNHTAAATNQIPNSEPSVPVTKPKKPTTKRVINSFTPAKSQSSPPKPAQLTMVKPLKSKQKSVKKSRKNNQLTANKPNSLPKLPKTTTRQGPPKQKSPAATTKTTKSSKNRVTSKTTKSSKNRVTSKTTKSSKKSRKSSKNRVTSKTTKSSTKTTKSSATHRNLWDRLRQGYHLSAIEHDEIQRFIDKYTRHPAYFTRIATKARPYLYHIVQEIEKRGMPLELALLPAIESAYEPMALSHKSAAGLWQFIPLTANEYGLKQNIWYDARRDIMASTLAALKYLQRLYKTFDQDWLLALAAYNYGQGNLRKAMNKNVAQEQPTDFWSLKLPTETREYVPKLLALAKIVAHPEEYGIKLRTIANQPYLQRVKIDYPMDLSLAANLAGLSSREFKRLNAAFRREAPDPEGPYHLTLPIPVAKSFKQRLAKLSLEQRLFTYVNTQPHHQLALTSPPAQSPEKTVLAAANPPVQQHQVSHGENLWRIAKRYNTTVAQLRELNNLKVDQALHVGKRLKVPTNVLSSQPTVMASNSESAEETQQHQVKKGETLWNIAKRYQTTVAVLRKLNELKDNSVMAGRSLLVPTTIAVLQKSVNSIQ